jgi:hypothetical protein
MLVVRTTEGSTHSSGQLVSREQSIGLHRIEPRAVLGQQTTDDPHPLYLALFRSPVVRTDPAPDLPDYVPACVVPDQYPHSLAQSLKLLAAPLQKARGYGAHWTTVHKAQPRLFELGHVQPVARDCLRIGVIVGDRLFHQTQWLASFAKAVQVRAASLCSTSTRPQSRPPNRL